MSAQVQQLARTPLDAERAAALRRFDDDVRMLCAAASARVTPAAILHRRAMAAYRSALENSGGRPYDAAWAELVRAVDALLAHADRDAGANVVPARLRLRALVEENADVCHPELVEG